MLSRIDDFLNTITMYRLLLYILMVLTGIAILFSFLGILSYKGVAFLLSTIILVAICWVSNKIFSRVFNAPTNFESVYITALILTLIITPIRSIHDVWFLVWTGVLAMGSKYIVAINRKHIFNPAAFAVVITSLLLNQSASWWIGTQSMMPFVLIGGLLIVRKLRRFSLVISFFIVSFLITIIASLMAGSDTLLIFKQEILDSPLLFFAFVMLTEPLTTPPTRDLQMIYGGLVGFLFVPQLHIGSIFLTPEEALLIGNVFSYLVSPKTKLILKLKEKLQIAPDTYEFVFHSNNKLNFRPGQYLEWTLSHKSPDSRGNRRYFTIASSPTENYLILGLKFNNPSSSFKSALLKIDDISKISASQLAGDFTLPKDENKKLVFIAGGIGITPFRSMIKYLTDTNQKRDIVIFYSNKTQKEIAFKKVFDEAEKKLGIKTVYVLSDQTQTPANWQGESGRLNEDIIKKYVPDYYERLFYISGPRAMITGFAKLLSEIGVKKSQVKTDFFPGFV